MARTGRGRRALQDLFTTVYRENAWGSSESRSGTGSELATTAPLRERLPGLIEALGVRSVVDVACGDLNWIWNLDLDLDSYLGLDVVPDLIARHQAERDRANWSFRVADVTSEAAPTADLILCRDVLVHFSWADLRSAIHNVKASRSTWLLTTTFPGSPHTDIHTGEWHPIDLEARPVGFGEPARRMPDPQVHASFSYTEKELDLWRISDLPDLPRRPAAPALATLQAARRRLSRPRP